jgi:hypothetical protein
MAEDPPEVGERRVPGGTGNGNGLWKKFLKGLVIASVCQSNSYEISAGIHIRIARQKINKAVKS